MDGMLRKRDDHEEKPMNWTAYRIIAARTLLAWSTASTLACSVADEPTARTSQAYAGMTNLFWFDNLPTDLRNAPSTFKVAVHRGLDGGSSTNASGNPIGAGIFVWTADQTSPEDGVTVIAATPGGGARTGAWKRVMDNTFNVQWFGAACDGVSDDYPAFVNALRATQATASPRAPATILLPPGRTCVLKEQLDLGNIAGHAVLGVTFRGAAMAGPGASQIQVAVSSACFTGAGASSVAANGGGILSAASTDSGQGGFIAFENLALAPYLGGASPAASSCLVNLSGNAADATEFTFHQVSFVGTPTSTSQVVGLQLSQAGLVYVDDCGFAGSGTTLQYAIETPAKNTSGITNYLNVVSITNSAFVTATTASYWDPNPSIYMQAGDGSLTRGPVSVHIANNYFDGGPNGIAIATMNGGDITGNWFQVEFPCTGLPTLPVPVWINVGGVSATIAGNHMNCSGIGIAGPLYGGSVRDNELVNMTSTGIQMNGGATTIEGNSFGAVPGVASYDLQIAAGNHHIGQNNYSAKSSVKFNVMLASGTGGTLETAGQTATSVQDNSNGGWVQNTGGSVTIGGSAVSSIALSVTNNSASQPAMQGLNASAPVNGSQPIGIFGEGFIGVQATSIQPGGYGLVAYQGVGDYAGYFGGNVQVTGEIFVGSCSGCASDIRLKKNVQPLTGALNRLLALRGVSFEWKDPLAHEHEAGHGAGLQTGFIAQDVESVFPSWVKQDGYTAPDGERYKTLELRQMEALEVESIRTLKEENDELKARADRLEERLRALERACPTGTGRQAGR
jgi:hypothetical protein